MRLVLILFLIVPLQMPGQGAAANECPVQTLWVRADPPRFLPGAVYRPELPPAGLLSIGYKNISSKEIKEVMFAFGNRNAMGEFLMDRWNNPYITKSKIKRNQKKTAGWDYHGGNFSHVWAYAIRVEFSDGSLWKETSPNPNQAYSCSALDEK